ncbi:MAG: alpha/beta fold hydrolase [Myxococcota bacterium]
MTIREASPPVLPPFLRPELPFRRRAIEVAGKRIHFIDEGRGRPVLLQHGNPTWSYLWRKVIRALGGEFRLIAPDLPGLGLSYKPRDVSAHSLAINVDMVGAVVDYLGLEDLILVGQDWGGPVAAGVGERFPERVGGMVWANTAVLRPARPFRPKGFHRFANRPLVSDLVFRSTVFPVPVLDRVQGDKSSIGVLEKRAYYWPLRKLRDRAAPLALARMIPTSEAHPTTKVMDRIGSYVEAYPGPAALVWGKRDPILGRALGRHQRALPQAKTWETGAGHFLQEEVPETIAEAIRSVARTPNR